MQYAALINIIPFKNKYIKTLLIDRNFTCLFVYLAIHMQSSHTEHRSLVLSTRLLSSSFVYICRPAICHTYLSCDLKVYVGVQRIAGDIQRQKKLPTRTHTYVNRTCDCTTSERPQQRQTPVFSKQRILTCFISR